MTKRLHKISNIVARVLTENPEARKDDFILINYVYDEMGIPSNFDMRTMLKNHLIFGLPSFESITRARRKEQKRRPELKDARTAEIRAAERKKYEEYSREM